LDSPKGRKLFPKINEKSQIKFWMN
jgi:hypothetical protein